MGSPSNANPTGTTMFSLHVLTFLLASLLPLVSAQARCQYYPLQNFADLFIEAQTFGEIDSSFTISQSNFTLLQNGKPTTLSASTLSTPLRNDLEITLIDQTNCAVYVELVIADPKSPHVLGAQIHFSFQDSAAGGVGLEVNRIDILKSSASLGTWAFNASATLGYAKGEDWEAIPQTDRTPREALVGAADSFLQWLAEEGKNAEAVPFGTPCSRLEGGQYNAEVCSSGFRSGSGKGVLAAEKRYVVDEVVGGDRNIELSPQLRISFFTYVTSRFQFLKLNKLQSVSQFKHGQAHLWLRKNVDVDVNATPPLPVLPQRARRLSLSVSDGGTSTSAFFQTLPPEIRCKILIAAFGGRTIHLDLRLLYPLRPQESSIAPTQKKPFFRRIGSSSRDNPPPQSPLWNQGPRHANTHHPDDRDTTKPRRWEWHGSICHRPSPTLAGFDEYPACEDECASGRASWRVDCASWPGEVPHKCLLGVMGWLRSCSAAYVEGVDVLYGTNRIHIQGTFLCRHLPEVVLPQRLAAVRMVELVWDLRLWGRRESVHLLAEDQPDDGGVERYNSLAAAIPGAFPGLRSLHISLVGAPLEHGKPEGVDIVEVLLQPLDEMVRRMTTLQECRVTVPDRLWREFTRNMAHRAEGSALRRCAWLGPFDIQRDLLPRPDKGSGALPACPNEAGPVTGATTKYCLR
ncbi:hypothetical protein QBC34DRAFT_464244 [Podospora aff. communis PSN243]|uniref:Uncharacterized protein n=1 Tax=Podospora aff. communis PSN243 TaxID=3040156 RepID=A0AAV9GJM2_9PEZI|nr:hypothetical protein QBC34DRAFT_464244 [Podospora aff. communis PSN243]